MGQTELEQLEAKLAVVDGHRGTLAELVVKVAAVKR